MPYPITEDNRVRDRTGKQPQRTVLSAQQVVGEVETTQHIKACTNYADSRDCVVVHRAIRLPSSNTQIAMLDYAGYQVAGQHRSVTESIPTKKDLPRPARTSEWKSVALRQMMEGEL